MADPSTTTASVGHPAPHPAGFPPFKTETFPSQIFWLAITFGFLFVVLWRFAGPTIADTIAARRGRINEDLAQARKARGDADAALADYETALAGARARAQSLAEETRRNVSGEVDRAKADADREAAVQLTVAEKQIVAAREAARGHVVTAAEEAARAIVQRLIGETIRSEDAANAVKAVLSA